MSAFLTLTLSHFRSHRRTEIITSGLPLALSGSNGAGKTNILEAISLFSPGRGLRRAQAEDFIRRPEALGWKLTATLQASGRTHEVETWAAPGEPRQVRVDGKAASQTALGRIARILWLVPSMDRLWIEGAEGRRRFLDRIALSFEPSHAEASLAYEKAMRERNRLLKDDVRDAHWYLALETRMAEEGARIRLHRARALERLEAAQAEAETVFPAADLALTEPESAADLREALAIGRPADLRAGRTLCGPHRADLTATYSAKGVPAAQCSTGEQKALLLSIVLANARALAREIDHPPVLLLDEVAAHLDPGRRANLYDEIVALGAQAWLTGTEPELFEALGDRATHLIVAEESGVSKVSP
ncbi:MAG: DNA replication/repair protein RecF [Pseudomonadota bacterium]